MLASLKQFIQFLSLQTYMSEDSSFYQKEPWKNPLKSYDCFFYQLKSSHHRGINVLVSFEAPDPFGSFFLVSAIML